MPFDPLWDNRDIERWMNQFQDEVEEKIIETLKYVGDEFVRRARIHGEYRDRSGNLRSSIGYSIVQDGTMVKEDILEAEKGSDKKTGKRKAKRLMETVAEEFNTGWVLIGVAGMDYAVYVENIHGRDVISSSAIIAEGILRDIIKSI